MPSLRRIIIKTLAKRWRRFIVVSMIIIFLSMIIPILTISWFYQTGIHRVSLILGEAWYLRISVGEPTIITTTIERIIPFWRYPIFAVEYEYPFAPKAYYTYENLITTSILAIISATLVCLYSELISIRGYGIKTKSSNKGVKSRPGYGIRLAGVSMPAIIQSGAVAYAGVIGCSTCYGSLLVQITIAGFSITITSTLAAYAGQIVLLIGITLGIILIYVISKRLKRLGEYNMRVRI